MVVILCLYLVAPWLIFSKLRIVRWSGLSGTISLLFGVFDIIHALLALFNVRMPSGRVTVTGRVVGVTPSDGTNCRNPGQAERAGDEGRCAVSDRSGAVAVHGQPFNESCAYALLGLFKQFTVRTVGSPLMHRNVSAPIHLFAGVVLFAASLLTGSGSPTDLMMSPAQAAEEMPKEMLAAQIRTQGFVCDKAMRATRTPNAPGPIMPSGC